MRALVFLVLFAVGRAFAQSGSGAPPESNLFQTTRPDMSVVVTKHRLGADLVEVTMSRATFPKDVLRERIEDLGRRLGSEPRGLEVTQISIDPANPRLTFTKAKFAVDGMIDLEGGRIRLEPLVRAFCGLPEASRIQGISVVFPGLRHSTSTVTRLRTAAVDLDSRQESRPIGLEFRIALKTADPAQVHIPDRLEPKPTQSPSASAEGLPAGFWVAVGVAGLAAGVLVYSLLLRGGGSKPR